MLGDLELASITHVLSGVTLRFQLISLYGRAVNIDAYKMQSNI